MRLLTPLLLVLIILCSFAVFADDYTDLKDKIDSASSAAQAESYRGQVNQLDNDRQVNSLLKRIDDKKAVLTRPDLSLTSTFGGFPVWVIGLIILLVAGGGTAGILAVRKKGKKNDDIEQNLLAINRLTDVSETLSRHMHKKQELYRGSIRVFTQSIAKTEYDAHIRKELEERFKEFKIVAKAVYFSDDQDYYWLADPSVKWVKRLERLTLKGWKKHAFEALGHSSPEIIDRVKDSAENISKILERGHRHPTGKNVSEALRLYLLKRELGGRLVALRDKLDEIIEKRNPEQKKDLNRLTLLESHELSLLKKYYNNLTLEENTFKHLSDKLKASERIPSLSEEALRNTKQEEDIVELVEIEDSQLAEMIKRLASMFRELNELFTRYNTHLENERQILREARKLVKQFKASYGKDDLDWLDTMRPIVKKRVESMTELITKEGKIYYEIAGSRPAVVTDNAVYEVTGLFGRLTKLMGQIRQRQRQIDDQKKIISKIGSSSKKKKGGDSIVDLGYLKVISPHDVLIYKARDRFNPGGTTHVPLEKKIYLVKTTTLTAKQSKNKKGYIYADVPTLDNNKELRVIVKNDNYMYSWDGVVLHEGDKRKFADLEFEFGTERQKKHFVDAQKWVKVNITKPK